MDNDELLNLLIFCNVCYYPHKQKQESLKLLISYCMHIVCTKCLKETDYCIVCCTSTTLVPLNNTIKKKINRNPSELFARPTDITMFQINSSINLIEYYREEIHTYKKLLKLARLKITNLQKNAGQAKLKIESSKPKSYKHTSNITKEIVSKMTKDSSAVLNFSNSSVNSNRLTIPKNFNPYKKFYRK